MPKTLPFILRIACTGLGLLAATGTAPAQPRATVVELFTSEGCSSCPPAEALIGTLARSRPDVIALAFHVDYWDYTGWRDRFEIPEAVERQRQYERALHLNTVYTPQLVIDGRRDTVGNNDPSTVAVSENELTFPLDIAVRADVLQISLGASSSHILAPRAADDVLLVSYLPEGTSRITRGENAGRELHEFNIVRSAKVVGSWRGEAKSIIVPLKSLPADATQVAVLVQERGEGPIVGAITHSLR
jgi:hypothetical protein